ncbi:cytochrome c oxidase assembly protein [Virgibacillus senegalensis]|uniref:cytochrome c oxidase assembly protein n=1 Tax=Virgibacillus senegalensis TaxID=1499679 RepID=UPI00069DE85B|nr:cytochrome c oxidase assembly protein [Virgibacillus senegalensis]
MDSLHHNLPWLAQLVLLLPFVTGCVLYLIAIKFSAKRERLWPLSRTLFWISGCILAALAVFGPLAILAHHNFFYHMLGHILLGMLAPLLMVLGAPVTLLLRALPAESARRISRLLKSRPVQFLGNPAVASFLNIGGLWVLYVTPLYGAMHHVPLLHILIHLHIFIAGYVFTSSIIYIDPTPHRSSFRYRTIILLLALAGHSILAKYLYAHPPLHASVSQAEAGSMLMYYTGDFIDAILIFLLCQHWYKSARPRVQKLNKQEAQFHL